MGGRYDFSRILLDFSVKTPKTAKKCPDNIAQSDLISKVTGMQALKGMAALKLLINTMVYNSSAGRSLQHRASKAVALAERCRGLPSIGACIPKKTAGVETPAVFINDLPVNDKDAKLPEKRKPIRHNKPKVKNLGANLIEIFQGRDATKISGITDYSWLRLLSEIGSVLTPCTSEKYFTSWLGLTPGQHDSGKKKRNKRKKGRPKAGQIFRVIAQSLIESKNIALGAFGRRIRAKKGPAIAIKATARKISQLYWRVMVKGIEYAEFWVKHYEQQLLLRKQKSLERLALELNIELVHKQQHEFCCH